jgi:hypothetical protein
LRKGDENTLAKWETMILRKIFGPVKENGAWRICTNQRVDESIQRTRYYLRNQKRKF